MILLDTNILVRFQIKGTREDLIVREWLGRRETLSANVMVWTEFLCGPSTPEQTRLAGAIIGRPIELTAPEASRAAFLFNRPVVVAAAWLIA